MGGPGTIAELAFLVLSNVGVPGVGNAVAGFGYNPGFQAIYIGGREDLCIA